MKRFLLLLSILLFFAGVCFGAGTSPADPAPVKNSNNQLQGVTVTITATADSSTALFLPAIFDSTDNNTGAYDSIKGRWLTSARTTPNTTPAPTVNYDIYIVEKSATDDFVLNSVTLAIGSDISAVSNVLFNFVVDGVQYNRAAVAAGTEPGNDVIPQSKYGAVAYDIGANGTIDVIEAATNSTGYTTAALAIAGVAAAASDHVRMGYVTAMKSDGAFTFGTTALNAGNTTVAYTSTVPAIDVMGAALANRSATAAEEVYPANSNGDNVYYFVDTPFMVIPVNNSVNSAVTTIKLKFN